jgi:hypothetical protein
MPPQHELDLRAPQRLERVGILLARNGEGLGGALVFKGRHQEIDPLGYTDETPLASKPAGSARRGSVQFGRTK